MGTCKEVRDFGKGVARFLHPYASSPSATMRIFLRLFKQRRNTMSTLAKECHKMMVELLQSYERSAPFVAFPATVIMMVRCYNNSLEPNCGSMIAVRKVSLASMADPASWALLRRAESLIFYQV